MGKQRFKPPVFSHIFSHGVSAMLTALAIPYMHGGDRISDKLTADALNALHLYVERLADDFGEFTI